MYLSRAPIGVWTIGGEGGGGDNNISIVGQGSHREPQQSMLYLFALPHEHSEYKIFSEAE